MSPNDQPPEPRTRADINRANAQHSTGPRTPEGKARSAQNALKHGLYAESAVIRGESPEELADLHAAVANDLGARDSVESGLAAAFADAEWKRRRATRIEAAYSNHILDSRAQRRREAWEREKANLAAGKPVPPEPAAPGLEVLIDHNTCYIERAQRMSTRSLQQMSAALTALAKLRTARHKAPYDWRTQDEEDRYQALDQEHLDETAHASLVPTSQRMTEIVAYKYDGTPMTAEQQREWAAEAEAARRAILGEPLPDAGTKPGNGATARPEPRPGTPGQPPKKPLAG